MLFRNCAGGVVFHNNKVFLLKNEKEEWVLPKGKIRNGFLAAEMAIVRVKEETDVDANIISSAGGTSYEFFSLSRQKPVCNNIKWYIMEALNDQYKVSKEEGFIDGGFYSIDDALEIITHNQEKALVNLSYKKYLNLAKDKLVLV